MNSLEDKNKIIDLSIKTSELQRYFMTEITDNMIYKTFFKDVNVIDFNNNEVILTFDYFYDNTEAVYNSLYKEIIDKTISEIFGKDVRYKIIHKDEVKNINNKNLSNEKEINKQVKSFFQNEYSEKFTFDTYLKSEFNKESIEICKSIVNQESDLNILFISGPSGIGKTHLLQAVGNKCDEMGKKSIYITPIIFNKKILGALQDNNTNYISKLLSHLTSVDILLFDDFQIFGEGQKKQTKNFIYQIIDARMQKNKPTIISAEMDLKDLKVYFEDRLYTRLQAGFLTKIKKPEVKEYKDLLDFLLEQNGVNSDIVDQESKDFFVREFSTSIRALLGAVTKVKYYKNDLLKADYVFSVIKNIFKDYFSSFIAPTPEIIVKAVSNYYKVNTREIMGKTRKKEIVIARHIAIILMDNLLNMSSTEIGKYLNKDHTTILNALKKSKNDTPDSSLKLTLDEIKNKLHTGK
ncbi:chromosomal replication initiation protein [Mycoplasmopsis canis UF31]|uniref:DnaA ATPase domain-containing protein n=1 Tax=Mycoplasmopsis canis TaxID=29555 RepID=UPI00025AD98B|nr:DnaA/Hda family protein [Mycoplasmopsis canis]EIE41007.1 chromosomal replication initiation protein [Mycoplasmopsis canis UF31]